ncbi:MAG: hypothetical protein ACYSTY_11725 [Planctomycetota bacterium]
MAQRKPSPAPEAQTTQPARQTDSPPQLETPDPERLLAGPKVTDEPGGGPASFAGRRGRAPLRVPARQWFALVGELDLERRQRAEVESIWEEYRVAARRFRTTHGAQLAELRHQVVEAREEQEAGAYWQLRRQLDQLLSLVPAPHLYQQQVWDRLTASQREELRRRLAARREALARQQAEQSRRRRDMTDDRRPQDRRPPEGERPQGDVGERDR